MSLAPGTRLGPYEIVAKLGEGGMGEVYRARDARLGRDVAIKVLPPAFAADQDRAARFTREARAAAALSHPHIAAVYDVGEADPSTGSGHAVPFIAMELVEGQPLDARIAAGALPSRDVVALALQVADALEEAHGRGIVHRDIKPANVMLGPRGRAKVLDFGLAKALGTAGQAVDAGELATITAGPSRTGMVVGTAPYMSPEQALGRDVDERSDLFSLGAVVYEATTGRRPFTGGSLTEVADQILHGNPPPMARLADDVPGELERIVRKCLEKDRERRYQTARELAVDLRNLQRDLEPGSRPASGDRETRRSRAAWWRRPVSMALGATVFVVCAVGVFWLATRSTAPPAMSKKVSSLAVLPLRNLSGDSQQDYFSDGMTEWLIAEFAKIKGLSKVPASQSVMTFKGTNKTLPEIASALGGVDAFVTGTAVKAGSRVGITVQLVETLSGRVLWARDYDRDVTDAVTVLREVARTVAGEIQVALSPAEQVSLSPARPVSPAVQDALLKGRFYVAQAWRDDRNLDKALASFEEAVRMDPLSAEAHAEVGKTYGTLGNWGRMPQAEAFAKSRDAALKALELDDRNAEAHKAICYWHFTWQHDWPLAEREVKRALELAPNDAEAHYYYAEWMSVMGRYDEAVALQLRACALAPLRVGFIESLGRFYYWGRRYDDAKRTFLAALELEPQNPSVLDGLADLCLQQGRLDEAWMWEEKSFRARPDLSDNDRRRLADAWRAGGWPAVLREDLALLARSETSAAEKAGISAAGYLRLGEKDRALEQLEVAYREHSSWMWGLNAPVFDSVRDDPRFKDLRRRVNLPEK